MEENDEIEVTDVVTDISVIPPKIQRFVHLYMTGQYTMVKLAQLLNVTPVTLYKWAKREDVKTIILDMQESNQQIVEMQLKSLTVKAVNRLSSLVDSPIDGVAMQAVKDILDRSGHKPTQNIKIDKTVRTYEERLSEIMEKTLDVEYSVVGEDE